MEGQDQAGQERPDGTDPQGNHPENRPADCPAPQVKRRRFLPRLLISVDRPARRP